MASDVVVTGLGTTTPLGGDVTSTWDGLLNGRSGVRPITAGWVERYELPARIAGQLAVEPAEVLPRVQTRGTDRCQQVALIAAREAWADAGFEPPTDDNRPVDPERLGVAIGSGMAGALTLLAQDDVLESGGVREVSPLAVSMFMTNGPAAWVGIDLKARAGVHAPASACASGAEGIAVGYQMIWDGLADVVVAGGADTCIGAGTLASFAQARTLSTRNDEPDRASRPFDVDRDGFVLGEGAGAVVLERAAHAAARGARVYARLAGVGITSDAYHMTAPDPDGVSQARAITAALRAADLHPGDVGHVNTHATATPVGDVAEARAIRKAIGAHPVLTAPKGALGHLIGGSGAVESIITVLSVYFGVIPPTRNLDRIDPRIDLDVVVGEPRKVVLAAAISDSFGFGGHNLALAFTSA